jgi:hypothetical protein
VLSSEDFKAFAKDHVLFLHVTSLVEGDKYPELLSEKGGGGWPYVVALDSDGNVVSFLGYEDMTIVGFKAMMTRGAEFQALKAKKDRTPAEEFRVLSTDLKGGTIQPADFREKAAALKGLDEAAAKERDDLLVHIEFAAEMKKLQEAHSPDPKYRIAAGKVFAAMHAAGRVPKEQNEMAAFYQITIDYAESVKEVALFETALAKLRESFGDNPRAQGFFKMMDDRLAKLKGPAEGKKDDGAGGPADGGKKDEGGGK